MNWVLATNSISIIPIFVVWNFLGLGDKTQLQVYRGRNIIS